MHYENNMHKLKVMIDNIVYRNRMNDNSILDYLDENDIFS